MRTSRLIALSFILSIGAISFGVWKYTYTQYPISPLHGPVSDCSCSSAFIDQFNNQQLYPALKQLCEQTFFTYFKVNYWRDCEIWPEDNQECTSEGSCEICPCDSEEIPEAWRCADGDGVTDQNRDELFTTLPAQLESQLQWNQTQTDVEDLWILHDLSEEYINLQINPERNTGYGGPHAGKIWRAIYMENCFRGKLENQCLEERAFYRLVSGIHASTAILVAERFNIISQPPKSYGDRLGANRTFWEFTPNVDFFVHHVGKFPDRLTNVYFTWAVLLRAFHKSRDYLIQYPYDTGNNEHDARTYQLIHQVLDEGDCSQDIFDESTFFTGAPYKELLKNEFKKKFLNVSRIMDCVACQNCRIHGKLSMLGLATAMKILLDLPPEQLSLKRNEIIALTNTLWKFSESIRIIEMMQERIQAIMIQRILLGIGASVLVHISLYLLSLLLCSRSAKSTKQKIK